jgi:transposase
MSRLENVRETLRLALEELAGVTGSLPRPQDWPQLWERYVESKLDYRTESGVLREKMNAAGVDAAHLLDWVRGLSDPGPAGGEKVRLLERVWKENFEFDPAGQCQQRETRPAGAVQNPHEAEAQWASKGQGKNKKEHVGYKVQVAESVSRKELEIGEPTQNFITAMATQAAIASDEAGLALVEKEQAQMGLEKATHLYVDGAYVSAEKLAHAQAEGQQIIGPAQPAPKKEGRFSAEDFQITVEERKAVCPAGKESTQCSRLEEEATGKVNYRFEFSTHCHECALRAQCVGKDQPHRTLTVGQYHTHLQARRQEQKTEEFKKEARHRNAIEGTQSELVRAHGLRRARYRGLVKMRLQNYLIGGACNIKRWIRRAVWILEQAMVEADINAEAAAVN